MRSPLGGDLICVIVTLALGVWAAFCVAAGNASDEVMPSPVADTTQVRLRSARTKFVDTEIQRLRPNERGPGGIWPLEDKSIVLWYTGRGTREEWHIVQSWPTAARMDWLAKSYLKATVFRDGSLVLATVPTVDAKLASLKGFESFTFRPDGEFLRSATSFATPLDQELLRSRSLLPETVGREPSVPRSTPFEIADCLFFPTKDGGFSGAAIIETRQESKPRYVLYAFTSDDGRWRSISRFTGTDMSVLVDGVPDTRRPCEYDLSAGRVTLQWIEVDSATGRSANVSRAFWRDGTWSGASIICSFEQEAGGRTFTRIGGEDYPVYIVNSGVVTVMASDGCKRTIHGDDTVIVDVVPSSQGVGPTVIAHPKATDNQLIFYDLSGRLPLSTTPVMVHPFTDIYTITFDSSKSLSTYLGVTTAAVTPPAPFMSKVIFRMEWSLDPDESKWGSKWGRVNGDINGEHKWHTWGQIPFIQGSDREGMRSNNGICPQWR